MLNWAYLPYTLPLSLFGIVALALSFYAARHRKLRGAQAFIGKPFDPQQLIDSTKQLLPT